MRWPLVIFWDAIMMLKINKLTHKARTALKLLIIILSFSVAEFCMAKDSLPEKIISPNNPLVLELLNFHHPQWTKFVKLGKKAEVANFLKNISQKKWNINFSNLSPKQQEKFNPTLLSLAFIQSGHFIQSHNGLMSQKDLQYTAMVKPFVDNISYWSYLSNTSSLSGNDLLLADLTSEQVKQNLSFHKTITELLLTTFEGVPEETVALKDFSGEYYTPNLLKPYFKKNEKKQYLTQIIKLQNLVTNFLHQNKTHSALKKQPRLLQFYQDATARLDALKQEKKFHASLSPSKSSAAPSPEVVSQIKNLTKMTPQRQIASEANNNSVPNAPNAKNHNTHDSSTLWWQWWWLVGVIMAMLVWGWLKNKNK